MAMSMRGRTRCWRSGARDTGGRISIWERRWSDYLEHGNVQNAVNFPDVVMARESPYRVGVANANVPNMVGQISGAMAKAGLNIHNMINRSKGEMAYTLVDVDSPVDEGLIGGLERIKGVLAVRYLPLS